MWRRLLAVLGLGATVGCKSQGALPGLPDSIGARVAFSPDGMHALVLPSDQAYAYDLNEKRVVWRRETAHGRRGVAFSPQGRYAVLVESEDTTVRVRVLDFRDGQTLQTFRFPQNPLSPECEDPWGGRWACE